ncbi:hypothetical protein Ancab_018793, partial [Ancistrocladus abbreviatus]
MEDTTEFAVWTKREGKAAVEEEKGMKPRTKPTQISLQKDLGGTVSKGASTGVALDELGINYLSPQVDHRRQKEACSPGPRKPKRDGAKRSKLKTPKESRKAQPRQTMLPNATNGERPLDQELPNAEAVLSGISLKDSNIENRNKVILKTLNQVSAEEIWEVGKQLGVRAEEPDWVVVQRIAKAQKH